MCMTMRWKFTPSLFQPKNRVFYSLKNRKFTKCSKLRGYPQKENRQRTAISSACCGIYFRNRNRIVRSRFRLSYFVTVLIQVSARTLPSSAELPIEIRLCVLVAHSGRNFYIRFFNLFEQSLLLFCESGSDFRFMPHNGYKRSAFVCAACYTLHCFFKEWAP